MADLFDFLSVKDDAINLDSYIARLEELRSVYGGGVLVQKWLPSKGRHNAPKPGVAFPVSRDIGKGFTTNQFWSKDHDPEDRKGPPVIRV